MADNSKKTWLNSSLNTFAEKKIRDAIQKTGRGLPCSVVSVNNSIVTVNFEVNSGFTLPRVTMPMFGPEYIRYPIQPGDKGVAVVVDTYVGGVSGLGGGVADLTQRANLSTLVWLPISNTAWSAVDQQAVVIYGPNGVVCRDTASNSTFVLTPNSIVMVGKDQVSVTSGGANLTLLSNGNFALTGSGTGHIEGDGGLTLTDNVNTTSVHLMNSVWNALTVWANTHTHPVVGSEAIATDTPYIGGNIAP